MLAPKVLAATTEGGKKPDDINVALIGAGIQGQVLLDACLKIDGIRFKAVCDIWKAYNLKRASGQLRSVGHDNNSYVDYREMLDKEKDLDAVIIATPDFWHAEHTVACLRAGLHVYCEKAMSNTVEGARNMVRAARETGKLLQIGHQRRSNPRYLHCCNGLIKELELLGRMTNVYGQWNRSVQPDIGWPKKYPIDEATLNKYGYNSMHQFKNWRWYKGLGGGPVVDLGAHQIDIFNWFLGTPPSSVAARGGTHYYDKKTHEWYDTVMAVLEYETREGTVSAYYQAITTNGYGGYYEVFMGDKGSLEISESAGRGSVYPDRIHPTEWERWVRLGYLKEPGEEEEEEEPEEGVVLDVRETVVPPSYKLPVQLNDPYHKPHLENFLKAIRGEAELNCPPEVAYRTVITLLKVNEAVEAGRTLDLKPEEFAV